MRSSKQLRVSVGLLAVMFLSACATTETMIAAPTVQLKTVELSKVSFNQQTFLLGFDVSNPNSFPLPVKAVKYRLLFDDKSFANGETRGNLTKASPMEKRGEISPCRLTVTISLCLASM